MILRGHHFVVQLDSILSDFSINTKANMLRLLSSYFLYSPISLTVSN